MVSNPNPNPNPNQDDERTEHSGNAPAAGVKYAINCWIRAGPVSSLGLG